MSTGNSFERIFSALREKGALLEADAVLPSIARLVIGGPFKGSWWGHPAGNQIYMVGQRLIAHPDVLLVKLMSAKLTYVHRRLWPSLFALATSAEDWQIARLSPSAAELLARVNNTGTLRTDGLKQSGPAASRRADIRALETRLLVYSSDIHTEAGRHAKVLESWKHLAQARRLALKRVPLATAKAQFEQIAEAWNARYRVWAKLRWKQSRPPVRKEPNVQ